MKLWILLSLLVLAIIATCANQSKDYQDCDIYKDYDDEWDPDSFDRALEKISHLITKHVTVEDAKHLMDSTNMPKVLDDEK